MGRGRLRTVWSRRGELEDPSSKILTSRPLAFLSGLWTQLLRRQSLSAPAKRNPPWRAFSALSFFLCSPFRHAAVYSIVARISEACKTPDIVAASPWATSFSYQDFLSHHPWNAELARSSSVIHSPSSTRLWSPGYNKPLMAAISLHPCPRHAHRNRHKHPCADTFRGGVKGNKQQTWRRHQLQGRPPMMLPPAPFVACDQCHVG